MARSIRRSGARRSASPSNARRDLDLATEALATFGPSLIAEGLALLADKLDEHGERRVAERLRAATRRGIVEGTAMTLDARGEVRAAIRAAEVEIAAETRRFLDDPAALFNALAERGAGRA